MSTLVVLDLETQDDWISQGRGSGWPEKQAKFLCAATLSNGEMKYWNNIQELLEALTSWDDVSIVAHNAQYEAGLLHSYGFDIKQVTWIDTKILAVLFYNNLLDFSLDGLAKRYLGEEKSDEKLGDIATELGLVKPGIQNPVKVAKANMEKVFKADEETVKTYVIQDVYLTHRLYNYFRKDEDGKDRFTQKSIDFHSDLVKALTLSRARGVRVHIPTAIKTKYRLAELKRAAEYKVEEIAPGVNINSSAQMAVYFLSQDIEIPVTDKGNPSITKAFLEEVDHPLGLLINETKKITKLLRDFIEPVLATADPRDTYCRVYPEIKIYGAAATGRATCSHPNLQQVPKRDKALGALIRKIYRPEEGDFWASLDFSAQEPRLQVHYANKIGAPGAQDLVDKFTENSRHDLHQQVADLAGITRNAAKTINLGLSYGMGDRKLAESLKVSFSEAQALKRKFNKLVPFLSYLDKYSKYILKNRGHIMSLEGRKIYNETGFERKALNKLIQGGAADQTWHAIVDCYRAGITITLPIHDSLEISTNNMEVVDKVKHIMENTTPLTIPSVTDVEMGPSWGDLK